MRGLKGKRALVAGGATGIGAATARRLTEEGARVVIADINAAGAEKTAAAIRDAGGEAYGTEFDISEEPSVKAAVDFAKAKLGGLDLLHVNAAALHLCPQDTNVMDVDLDVFDEMHRVNLRGHLLCTRHALPLLLENEDGAIVYTSSIAAVNGTPSLPGYSTSKAAINALARHVASTWGKQGIRANAVQPGLVMSEAVAAVMTDEMYEARMKIMRSTRLGQPEDIAAMIAFLLSEDGEWINGQVITVDGGTVLN